MKLALLKITFVLCFLAGCTAQPSDAQIQAAIAKTAAANPAANTTPKPLADIDLDDMFIQAEDLTFSGLYQSADWKICKPANRRLLEFTKEKYDGVVKSGGIVWKTPECGDQVKDKSLYVEEYIYITGNAREAERIADSIQSMYSMVVGGEKFDTFQVGDMKVWMSQVTSMPIEWSAITIVNGNSLIIFSIFGDNLVEGDLNDLVQLAVDRMTDAQLK